MYDFVLPILLTVATCAAFSGLNITLAVFAHPELVARLTDLLELMIVFYMAALAAVATFDRTGIDNPLDGGDATLRIRHHNGGKWITKKLSYRQFISYLFGYLSFLSLCLYVVVIVLAVGWPEFEHSFYFGSPIQLALTNYVDPAFFFMVFFAVWQLIITSLLGIYFLTERIQTLSDHEK